MVFLPPFRLECLLLFFLSHCSGPGTPGPVERRRPCCTSDPRGEAPCLSAGSGVAAGFHRHPLSRGEVLREGCRPSSNAFSLLVEMVVSFPALSTWPVMSPGSSYGATWGEPHSVTVQDPSHAPGRACERSAEELASMPVRKAGLEFHFTVASLSGVGVRLHAALADEVGSGPFLSASWASLRRLCINSSSGVRQNAPAQPWGPALSCAGRLLGAASEPRLLWVC